MDARGFQIEYKRLILPLGMFALRIVGSVTEAEDVVQTAFLKVWDKVSAGEGISNFKAYMYMTVRNIALDSIKNSHKDELLDENLPVSDEDIDTSDRDARIWRIVDSLPERCRQVLLMSKRDGMTNAQIAEELGISIKTVENQMTKALNKLRGYKDLKILTFFL